MLNIRTFIKTIITIAFIIVATVTLLDVNTLLSAVSLDYDISMNGDIKNSMDYLFLTNDEKNTYLLMAGISILGKSLIAYGLAVVYKLADTYKLGHQ